MGLLDRILPDRIEEAADLKVAEQRLSVAERSQALEMQVRETASQIEMRDRVIEDLQWQLIQHNASPNGPGDTELDAGKRQDRNNQTERMYREDALIRRAVNLSSEYVFGRGMQKPAARDPRVQRVIDSMWADPNNKQAFFDLDAQFETNVDLECHGELFILIFDDGDWRDLNIEVSDIKGNGTSGLQDPASPTGFLQSGSTLPGIESAVAEGNFEYTEDLSGGKYNIEITGPLPESAVKISKIHPNEITDVIRDTKSSLITRYYRRERVPYKFDFQQGQPIQAFAKAGVAKSEVTYYEDFENPPPNDYDNKAPSLGKGRILHITINKGSHSLRGNSDVWVAIRWARLLNDYFEWRVTLLRAWATFPFKRKIKGGMSQVLQAAQRMGNSQVIPGTGVPGNLDARGVPAQGSIITENETESLEQFKTTSGAGEAEQDILALRSQAGLPMGLPPSYLGGPMDNLNNSTALEFPVLKRFSARQELYEKFTEKLIDHGIKKAVAEGLIPEDADLTYKNDLPNILERNIPELVNAINQIAARLDPFSINFKLKRFLLLQGLIIMGINNPQKIVADIYPPGSEEEERKRMQELTMGAVAPTQAPNNASATTTEPPVSDLDPLKNKKQQASQESLFPAGWYDAEADGEVTDVDLQQLSSNAYIQFQNSMLEMIQKMEQFGTQEIERTRM